MKNNGDSLGESDKAAIFF